MREDGTWVDFYYVGSWSKWQGAGDHWHTATTREDWGDDIPVPTVDMQTTADVVRLWNVDRIIANIADALDRQLNGKSEQRTKTARERAAKLRALAELVKS